MPDFFSTPNNDRVPDGAPRDWSEAFAALPLETPPGDSWSQLIHAQDTRSRRGHRALRERRTTWLIGLASAAVLVVAAWSPLSQWLQDRPTDTTSPAVTVTAAAGSRRLTTPVQTPSNTGLEAARTVAIDTVEKPTVTLHADRDGRATVAPQPRTVQDRPFRSPHHPGRGHDDRG